MSSRSGTATVVALVVLVTALLIGVVLAALFAFDRPRVEEVDSEWGTVTQDRTEVRSHVAIENPQLLRVADAAADVEYTVTLNDVEVGHGRKEQVRLSGRRDVVTVSTWINNSEIPRWWTSHVNNGETTTVQVDPTIVVDVGGFRYGAASMTRTRTVETNLLEPLRTDRTREVRALGQTVLYVNETDARWGNATLERTPIDASLTVTNPTPIPIPVTNVTYTIRMNDVVVGEGQAGEPSVIPPGSTRTIDARATIDNSRLDEWWVTHLRRNETTTLTVEFDAVIEVGAVRVDLPLEYVSYNRTFTTDILGTADPTSNSTSADSLTPGSATDGVDRTTAAGPTADAPGRSPRGPPEGQSPLPAVRR